MNQRNFASSFCFSKANSRAAPTGYSLSSSRQIRPTAIALYYLLAGPALAQSAPQTSLEPIVVSASRGEQTRFDVPAAIDAVSVTPFLAETPLVNLSDVLSGVAGLQVRDRQNFAQDLQVSIRGFGSRASFGVRGVRILVDGIPATMPDGQGQAASANLATTTRIEVLRGPLAQLYGNAAGGVLQIFTRAAPRDGAAPTGTVTLGIGSDGQCQIGMSMAGGSEQIGALIDLSHFSTSGFRDHSAAERNQITARIDARLAPATTITATLNYFDQPKAQDPLGQSSGDFEQAPRPVSAGALLFDTRKTIREQQAGVLVRQQLSDHDELQTRMYGGSRQVFQTLAFSGAAPTSAGGVVDLARSYSGLGLSWQHRVVVNQLPFRWTVGVDADTLREWRRGFVNNAGSAGALRRDEIDSARDLDFFGQFDWTFATQWRLIAGLRSSHVQLAIDDHMAGGANSGSTTFRKLSPVAGLAWAPADDIHFYANLGRGFETPTLTEAAYSTSQPGANRALQASTSIQSELGVKMRGGAHTLDLALFNARSAHEIVAASITNGRAIYRNVDAVERRGLEASWHMTQKNLSTQLSYTWLDARFRTPFAAAQGGIVTAGNRLPGAPQHSLYSTLHYIFDATHDATIEWRAESRVAVNDLNSDAAAGYGVLNLRTGIAIAGTPLHWFVFGRIDNVLDHRYAGSVIVNDTNSRYFEAAPGRRLFFGARSGF